MTGAVAFSMDTALGLPSQAPTEQEQWGVFRDAFALPQDTRRPRPWERSSVPAHAPRLQGQKIWKKAGIQIRNDKENETTLIELQSEGNGSRKKRKVDAVKENIGDARWTSKVSALEPVVHKEDDINTSNGDTTTLGGDNGEDDALRFVPRKRTNTDHVITPRKPLRQTQLNSQAQTLPMAPRESLDNTSTRRRKSLRRSSIRKSTSSRASARFNSGYGPSFLSEESSSTGIPIQQSPPDATSQFMFGAEVPLIVNHNAQNELLGNGPVAEEVSDSAKIDADCQEPLSVREMEGPKARKRSSIRRDSKRGSRSSASLASISEDLPAQVEPTIDNTRSRSVSNHDLNDFSDSAPTFGNRILQEVSQTTSLCAVQEASEPDASRPEAPSENQSGCVLPVEQTETDLPATVPSLKSIDTPSEVNRESSPGSPSEQLQRECSQGQHHMVWPAAVEAPSEYSTRLCDEGLRTSESCEDSIQPALEDASTLDSITIAAGTSQLLLTDSTAATSAPPTPDHTLSAGYEDDDTDMLRKFLTRVTANKAAKAENTTPKRKRSLPHSPLRLPLGEIDANASPSPLSLKPKEESTVTLPSPSPKRRKRNDSAMDKGGTGELKEIRRSGRTRLPVKSTLGAPSLIPVRRLGPDGGDSTVTIRRTEEKDIAALTRVNTRKNKGAIGPTEVLLLKAAEKADPALKQRLLKEMFEEKQKKGSKAEKSKSVTWAKELVQFQCEKKSSNEEKTAPITAKKPSAVRVGPSKSKISMSRAVNGTPAPKRRARERA